MHLNIVRVPFSNLMNWGNQFKEFNSCWFYMKLNGERKIPKRCEWYCKFMKRISFKKIDHRSSYFLKKFQGFQLNLNLTNEYGIIFQFTGMRKGVIRSDPREKNYPCFIWKVWSTEKCGFFRLKLINILVFT